jgi:hypothetical protein
MEFNLGDSKIRLEVIRNPHELRQFLDFIGVHSIIELQRAVGIEVSHEQAVRSWERMSCKDKHKTIMAFAVMFGPDEEVLVDPRIKAARFN